MGMYMTHSQLLEIGFKFLKKRYPVVFKDIRTSTKERPDLIGFRAYESCVVEVKASRSDFLRDSKKTHRNKGGMGTFRFYLCPENLIKIEDLPEKWGLIYVSDRGYCRIVHNPYNPMGGNIWSNGFNRNIEAEYKVMYSALRRNIKNY